jgi:hypothetical protein
VGKFHENGEAAQTIRSAVRYRRQDRATEPRMNSCPNSKGTEQSLQPCADLPTLCYGVGDMPARLGYWKSVAALTTLIPRLAIGRLARSPGRSARPCLRASFLRLGASGMGADILPSVEFTPPRSDRSLKHHERSWRSRWTGLQPCVGTNGHQVIVLSATRPNDVNTSDLIGYYASSRNVSISEVRLPVCHFTGPVRTSRPQ